VATLSNDLDAVRGDDEEYSITLMDEDGDPLDLAAVDIWFTAKRNLYDSDAEAVFQKTVGDGITVGEDPGAATLTILSEDTAGLPTHVLALHYDVQVSVAGLVKTPLSGKLIIRHDVTNSIA
jgi:protocatechuate 3,4-dioxygenase beta subunit